MKITLKDIMTHSLRGVFHNRKFVILLWGTNALAALVLTMPVYSMLIDNLSRSVESEKLAVGFDYMWYLQFRNLYEINLGEIPSMMYALVGIYVLIQTFFLGGLVSVFNMPAKNHTVDFFFGGVKYWYRFTKVLLISLIFFVLAFKIHDWQGDIITWMFSNSENALAEFILRSLRYFLLIFFIGLVTIVSDYMKVSLAIKDNHDVLKEIPVVIQFIRKNFNLIFITFLLVAVIGASGAVIYNFIGKEIPRTPFYFLILSFLLQQMLIIFRLLIRMLFCATEVILYKDLSAELITANARTN